MSDIIVGLKDYSMLKISCERGVAAELSDYFSFFVPGYKFMPAYKNRAWDGKIKLYNSLQGELNAGLFTYLIEFCKDRGYTIDVEETDYGFPFAKSKVDDDLLREFYGHLKLPYEIRDYQHDAIRTAVNRQRGVFVSPTGSGKSLIAYCLTRFIVGQPGKKVLIIVPTTSLVEQLTKDFIDYGWNEDRIHKIYSGKDKITKKRVIISTWQSIYKFPKQWFEQFEAVIGDECHGFKSKSLSSIMNKSTEAKYRFGLTGTLDGTQTHKLVLEGLFGPVYQVTKTKKLQDDGTLAALDITLINLKYGATVRENFGSKPYKDEIDFIVKHPQRNIFISSLALKQTGNTLVLFHRIEHGEAIRDLISGQAETGRKVFFVSGKVATDDREAIRRIVETQKNAIIVASMGTFSTGINIRNLHNIIFASPSKSQIKVLQSIGRGLRKSDDGSVTKLFDLVDDLHWSTRKNFTLLHGFERVKIYKNENFKYGFTEVDI